MSVAKVKSAQVSLLTPHIVDVEVDLQGGLHSFTLVGLPDKAIEESRDRVSAAIKNSGFPSPKKKNQKVVVSLAPADLKKEGPLFDLPVALAYLLAAEKIDFDPTDKLFIGELSLEGSLRPVRGVLPIVSFAKRQGFKEIYVPDGNGVEAALISGIKIFAVPTLKSITLHLDKSLREKGDENGGLALLENTLPEADVSKTLVDLADIKGQESAKRGLEIAAAGGHNIVLNGPPGTGKTMLARAFAGILPPLSLDEILEVTGIHSVAGALRGALVTERPVRSPHHTASYVSLVGGGTIPKPGEITLAHRGVLFLDEFPEFDKRVIEALRQPLEERLISISRSRGSADFPAHFILIAAMNPCPCGNAGVSGKECVCQAHVIERYQKKISGPIVDRVDMWLDVAPVEYKKLSEKRQEQSESEVVRERVSRARTIQAKRYEHSTRKIRLNSEVSARDIQTFIPISTDVEELLNTSATRYELSARAYHRVLKLARTIADLAESTDLEADHLLEAFQYRPRKMRA